MEGFGTLETHSLLLYHGGIRHIRNALVINMTLFFACSCRTPWKLWRGRLCVKLAWRKFVKKFWPLKNSRCVLRGLFLCFVCWTSDQMLTNWEKCTKWYFGTYQALLVEEGWGVGVVLTDLFFAGVCMTAGLLWRQPWRFVLYLGLCDFTPALKTTLKIFVSYLCLCDSIPTLKTALKIFASYLCLCYSTPALKTSQDVYFVLCPYDCRPTLKTTREISRCSVTTKLWAQPGCQRHWKMSQTMQVGWSVGWVHVYVGGWGWGGGSSVCACLCGTCVCVCCVLVWSLACVCGHDCECVGVCMQW